MVNLNKGLFTDGNKIEQPEGTWRNAENVVYDRSRQTLSKELGTKIYCNNIPSDHQVIGHLEIDNEIIVFLKSVIDTTGKIGIVTSSGFYREVLNGNFNFRDNYNVKAKFIRNSEQERIVIFTDGINRLRYVNIDNTISTFFEPRNELMSPEMDFLRIESEVKNGGSLPIGSFIPFAIYVNRDGIETNVAIADKPSLITSRRTTSVLETNKNITGTNSSSLIELTLTNTNTSFRFIKIGLIASIGETISAKIVSTISPKASTTTHNISKFEGEDFDITNLFLNKRNYKTVQDIEISGNEILLGNCTEDFELKYQKWANNILINYDFNSIDLRSTNYNIESNIARAFMPFEVYAFYIQFTFTDGSFSKAFHIPGRPSVANENNSVNVGGVSARTYQVQDTSNAVGATTNMAFWENEDELYPDTDDYNSTDIGGLDLRGQKVRHHRFPSMQRFRIGINLINEHIFPILGIDVSNIVIPVEFRERVSSFRILYAKRSIENMTVLGQDLFQHEGTIIVSDAGVSAQEFFTPASVNITTGGSGLSNNAIRFHAPDLLLDKPIIKPAFIKNEYRLSFPLQNSSPQNPNNNDYFVDGANKKKRFNINTLDTFAPGVVTISDIAAGEERMEITDWKYIPNDVIFGDTDNRFGESYLQLKGSFSNSHTDTIGTADDLVDGVSNNTFLSSLIAIPTNVYTSFFEQTELVATDRVINISASSTYSVLGIFGGDAYAYRNFNVKSGPFGANNFGQDATDPNNIIYKGFNTIARNTFGIMSSLVISYFDEDVSDSQSARESSFQFLDYDPKQDFTLVYNKDYQMLNQYHPIVPFNPFSNFNNFFPNRIHRSSTINLVDNDISITFPVNNFYTMPRNRGKIVGLNSFAERLVIRMEKSSYITVTKQKIQTDTGQALIGSNDIFEVEPDEIITTDKGFVGSQSKFNSISTEWGLLIIDEDRGKVFLFSREMKEISKIGNKNFFFNNLIRLDKFSKTTYNSVVYNSSDQTFEIQYAPSVLNETLQYLFISGDYFYSSQDDDTYKILEVTLDFAVISTVLKGIIKLRIDKPAVASSHTITHLANRDSPYTNDSIISGYDRNTERILITKRDNLGLSDLDIERYRGIYESGMESSLSVNDIVLKGTTYQRYNGSSFDIVTSLNRSFTISYNPEPQYEFWTSFHSYKPNFYISLNKNLFSLINNTSIHEHNITSTISTFFSGSYEMLLEVIMNQDVKYDKKYINLIWFTDVFNNSLVQQRDSTISSIQFTNSYQDSLEQAISIFVNINNKGNTRREGNSWRLNFIRDNITNKYFIDKYISVLIKDSSSNLLYLYGLDSKFNIIDPSR